MRLLQTIKLQRQRKHLMKRLKQNISDSEKYQYYLNKMEKLYKSYKKYDKDVIVEKMNHYLKLYGLKTSGFYLDEQRDLLLEQVSKLIKADFQHLMNAFKKLNTDTNYKLGTFNKMLVTSKQNQKTKTKFTLG